MYVVPVNQVGCGFGGLEIMIYHPESSCIGVSGLQQQVPHKKIGLHHPHRHVLERALFFTERFRFRI